MHKRAFQALKRTFMHASGLPLLSFDKKAKYFLKNNQNLVEKDLRHA